MKNLFKGITVSQVKIMIIVQCLCFIALLFWFVIAAKADDYLYFAKTPTTIGERTAYVLGAGQNKVTVYKDNSRLEVLQPNFQGSGKDLIRFTTSNQKHLKMADTMGEFIGTGYIDALARVAFGISNWTLNQISTIFRAVWWTGDSWISGWAKDWIDAGKPRPVYFTPGPKIQGKKGEMD